MKKIEFIVNGMMCANCKATVERSLKKTKGVKEYSVNLANNKAIVTYDSSVTSFEVIKENIEKEGYEVISKVELDSFKNKLELKKKKDKIKLIIVGILALIEFYASMGVMIGLPFFFVNSNPTLYVVIQMCLVISVVVLSFNIFTRGYKNLFRFHPSMESLVSIGCTASFGYSLYSFIEYLITNNNEFLGNLYFDSCAVILFLIQLGKYFETKSLARANNSINELLNATPTTVKVFVDNEIIVKDIKEVKDNEVLVASIGDSIAFDGVVIEGSCSVDESMLTGESLPSDKIEKSIVFAGTKVTNGYIKYVATSKDSDMMINKIIKMVEDAQASKAPIEHITDKVANVFTKVVLSIAVIVFIIWIIASKDFNLSIKVAVSILVIACPCSLGLATPTAIIVGSGVGAKNGIFYKNAEVLENFGKINTFAFDKTGTLTTGNFIIKNIVSKVDQEEFLEILGSVEQYSSHSLATSILKYVKNRNINIESIKDYKEISGLGVNCYIGEDYIEAGKIDILEELKDKAIIDANNGLTIIGVKKNHKDLGYVALEDEIKESAKEVIDYLHNEGVKVVLISGDNEKSSNNIGKILNVDKVYSNVSPLDKANIIKDIMKESTVCMVGDGINDSIALTSATVGLSFTQGTNIAVESSDIILMNNKLEDIIVARKLSKKIMRHIKQNLFFAFFYNCIGISLASGILYPFTGLLLNPMIGALAMSFSSVSVVSNSLRINTFKKEK